MIDPSPSPVYVGGARGGVAAPSIALRAYLALVAALGGGVTALMLMMSVAANSGGEAERIADAQGYTSTFVGALAANLSKPLR